MMSDAAMFEIPGLADAVDAGDDNEVDCDGDDDRINAPHSHAVWIIELRGGKHSRADIKEFLWDKYRCTPKGWHPGLRCIFEIANSPLWWKISIHCTDTFREGDVHG